jgi:hypothetical protein
MEELTNIFNEKWLLKDIKEYWYDPQPYILANNFLYIEGFEQLYSTEGSFVKFIPESKILIVQDQGIKLFNVIFPLNSGSELTLKLLKHYPNERIEKVLKVINNLIYCKDLERGILIINMETGEEFGFNPKIGWEENSIGREYIITDTRILINYPTRYTCMNHIYTSINYIYTLDGKFLKCGALSTQEIYSFYKSIEYKASGSKIIQVDPLVEKPIEYKFEDWENVKQFIMSDKYIFMLLYGNPEEGDFEFNFVVYCIETQSIIFRESMYLHYDEEYYEIKMALSQDEKVFVLGIFDNDINTQAHIKLFDVETLNFYREFNGPITHRQYFDTTLINMGFV